MSRSRCGPWLAALLSASLLLTACKGDTGEQGPPGEPGEPGEPGRPPDSGIDPEPLGLVGRIIEPNDLEVVGGTVYLVPAEDVAELAETPIDLFLSPDETAALEVDEPIEDLIDGNASDYEQASVDAEGIYRFETLPEGSYFVVWVPAEGDDAHFPGGDSSQVSFDTASLVGMQMDIRVSSRPGPSAQYVGSSTCLVCHALQGTARTAHSVGLQVPGVRSILQDVGPWPDFDAGLEAFEAGTTLYYFDCMDSASSHDDPSSCKVQVQDPGPGTRFQIQLGRDLNVPLGVVGAYFLELENLVSSEPVQRLDVVLTYGGALGKQQYLTRRTNTNGSFSYFLLPVQFNYAGDFDNGSLPGGGSSDDWPWRDYRSDLWYDFETDTLRDPAVSPASGESFDNNCAGCHFTGYELEGSDLMGWSASAAVDPEGAFDYDGDGRPELINTGCEACHGPGSDHLTPVTNGRFVVSPNLLTPGRRAALCGSCHSRPLGIGGGSTGLPLSESDEMPPPGIRRASFASDYTTRVSGAPEAFFESGDARLHYQEYSDHIRSTHYRNASRLVTCSNCHSPHANDDDIAEMDDSGNPNSLCTTCHADIDPVAEHAAEATGVAGHASLEGFFGPYLCTDCHMVPTAKSGAAVPALLDSLGGPPDVQYFWNDISSHRMTITRWDGGQPDQPIAFTNECGECHRELLPNSPVP